MNTSFSNIYYNYKNLNKRNVSILRCHVEPDGNNQNRRYDQTDWICENHSVKAMQKYLSPKTFNAELDQNQNYPYIADIGQWCGEISDWTNFVLIF